MGKHKEWRKSVKRERRRKIRIAKAKERDPKFQLSKEEYELWVLQQQEIETLEMELIESSNQKENLKWLEAEKIAIEQWKKLQEIKDRMRLEHLEKEAKLRLEWEREQKKKKEEEERLKELEEENKKRHESFMQKLEQFLLGNSNDPPSELLVTHETQPNFEICPFYSKTACCRFGDQCSRNHQHPCISNVLLAPSFFVHFGLNNANYNEYDTDLMLEYEDSDTYREFKEFFYDILPEFEQFGKIRQLKVCNNFEKHLRGNTYIEFEELRCAVAAYRSLHARWYGGRQLALKFCTIKSWKSAICGLQARRKCPKGRACNFLHVFRNPNNMFPVQQYGRDTERRRTPPRSWRWSESPELELPKSKNEMRYRSPSNSRRENRSPSRNRRRERRISSRSHSSRRRRSRESKKKNEGKNSHKKKRLNSYML